MAVSTRAVRWVLVAGAVLLAGVVLGFIGFAHMRLPNFHLSARKLGIDVTQESDNVTYSQSVGKRKVFTVHAAKQYQMADGKISLHDVGITLYGAKGDREDRIRGNEFEYDQKNGVLTAIGESLIDLGKPAAKVAVTKAGGADPMIHVKTTGLVFLEREKTANADGHVEFASGGMTGESEGATYDSGRGMVVLKSAVKVNGERNGRPMVLNAAHAELDQKANVLTLEEPRYLSTTESGTQKMDAAHAVVRLNEDGNPQRVEAERQVVLSGSGRGTIHAERLDADLNAAGQLKDGHLYGGVRFVEDAPARDAGTRTEQGRAEDAKVAFDTVGRPVHAVLTGDAQMVTKSSGRGTGKSERQLNAEKVDLALGGGGKEKVYVRSGVATGGDGARVRMVDVKAGGERTSLGVRADVLTARMAQGLVTGLDGAGKTLVERVGMDGEGAVDSRETSTGDGLKMDFRRDAQGKMALATATQRGNVQTVREVAAKKAATGKAAAAPEVEHARGDVGVYEADAERMTMTGGVEVQDATSALFADRVEMQRARGEATADGNVRVTYVQASGAGAGSGPAPGAVEPVHVLAGHAVAHKATGLTEFTAAAGAKVKMWQGGSQVEAPVLDLNRTQKTVVARSAAGVGDAAEVRAVLVDANAGVGAKTGAVKSGTVKSEAAKSEAGRKDSAGRKTPGEGGPVRVTSQTMMYTDGAREVHFDGKVRVDDQEGTMRSREATVYLTPAAAGAAAATQTFLGGRVDHMVSTGGVELEQPGRRATGEKLTYAASDQTYVLTGTKAAPPKLVDAARGTVTGAALTFRTGDDSVVVSGGEDGGRVRSDTRARQER